MQQINLDLPDGILQYLQVLQDALGSNYSVVLAGGFLRDAFGGATPKDLDILVAPSNPIVAAAWADDKQDMVSDIINRVEAAVIPDWFYVDRSCNCEYLADMKARGLVGLVMGVCPNLNNIESQLIIYGKHMPWFKMAHDMDMNINQVVMRPDGRIHATDAFVEGMSNGHIKVLHAYSPERTRERIGRMLSKYPNFKVIH